MLLELLVGLAVNDPGACAGRGTALYVNTAAHSMALCEAGQTKETLRVALGRGGVDKRKEGDAKVPLGEYSLGAAIPSESYHLFLPVAYPTAKQRGLGFTGSAIGVHGPARGFNYSLSTSVDWTLGCIAVGTDEEIERVSAWVKASRVRRIIIEAQ